MRKISVTIPLGSLLLLCAPYAYCFDVGTHVDLAAKAVRSSRTEEFLEGQLNFLGGVAEAVLSKSAIGWFQEGSLREDDSVRFVNHFHNPLRSWNEAGLRASGLPVLGGRSSILWGQNRGQGFTWQDARQTFFEALTFQGLSAATQKKRDGRLAVTFRTLGQLMHLVQDAAVPAHTRNDPHPTFDGFESFVDDARSTYRAVFDELTSRSEGFDTTILTRDPNPLAPVPIARIIDTTDPEQADAIPTDETNVGLAEYSNGNFLSGDTIFRDFTFPRVASLGHAIDGLDPFTGYPRSYFPKVADGETGFRLVATGTWTERLISALAGDYGYILDNGVYTDYAGLLLPRAIGYSAGLLNYFFRGQLEIAAPDRFLYGRTNFQEPFQTMDPSRNVNAFTRLTFKVRNATPDEDTSCPAGQQCAPPQLFAVVQYRTGNGVDLIRYPGADLSAELSFAVSKPLSVAPTRTFQELTFDFGDRPLPANAADVFLMVVYRGPLGLEADAVMVGGKDLLEPTPVDLANSTDYFCFNGVLQHVGDFGAYPPFVLSDTSPTPPRPRDPSGDGVIDLFGPYDEFGVYMKASPPGTVPSASDIATAFDQQLGQRTSAEYTRFVALQDQPFFTMSELASWLIDRATIPNGQASGTFSLGYQGNLNRMVAIGGFLLHQYLPSFIFRGLVTTALVFTVPQDFDSFLPCTADLFTKGSVTRIEGTLAGP